MSSKLVFGRYDYASFAGLAAYAASSVAVPMVLVELAASLGFPLESGGNGAGGVLQIGRSFAMMFSMASCGFLDASWGKRISLGAAIALMGAGIMLAAFSPVYGVLFAALAAAGLGEGVIEGLATPVVQDLHADDQPGRYINFNHSFWSVGVVATSIAAGCALYCHVNWRVILAVVGALALLPALLFLLPEGKHRFPTVPAGSWKKVSADTLAILRCRRFWIFFAAMFFAGGGEFSLTFWSAPFIRIAYGDSAAASGIGTAIFSCGMIVSRMGSGMLVPQRRLAALVIVMAAIGVPLGIAPAFLSNIWMLFLILFLLGIISGPFWPSIQSYAVDRLGLDSTMIFVLLSCAGIPGCGFFTWLLGVAADCFSMRMAILVVPACYLLVLLLIASEAACRRGRQSDGETPR